MQGALIRRIDKTQEDEDAKARRSKGEAVSTGGEEGLRQQARASAGECVTSGQRERTPCRKQVTESVDMTQGASARRKVPEDEDAEDRRIEAEPSPPEGRRDHTSGQG